MKLSSLEKTFENAPSLFAALSVKVKTFHFRDIRTEHIVYMLSIFLGFIILDVLNTWDAESLIENRFFSLDAKSLFFFYFFIGEGVSIFIINSKVFKILSVTGALCGGVGIAMEFIRPTGVFHAFTVGAAGLGLGMLGASILYVFIFVLYNTEKILICSSITLITSIFSVIYRVGIVENNFITSRTLSVVIITVIIFCVLKYRNEDSPDTADRNHIPVLPRGAYWLYYFIAVFLIIEGLGRAIVTQTNIYDSRMIIFNYIGAVIGVAVVLILRILFLKNAWFMWNIYFFICAVGFLFNLFGHSSSVNGPIIGSLFLGAGSASGYIAVWYLAGIISRRYRNMGYVRKGVVTAVLSAIIGNGFSVSIAAYGEEALLITGSIVSLLFILLFMLLSPVFYGFFRLGEWMDGQHDKVKDGITSLDKVKKPGITKGVKNSKAVPAKVLISKLTPREKELFRFLIEGYTLRQIAELMNISYNTVLTHYKNVYFKLGVKNKTELMRKYLEA